MTGVNGKALQNIQQLCDAITTTNTTDYVRLDLETGEVVVVEISTHTKANISILEAHGAVKGMSRNIARQFPNLTC